MPSGPVCAPSRNPARHHRRSRSVAHHVRHRPSACYPENRPLMCHHSKSCARVMPLRKCSPGALVATSRSSCVWKPLSQVSARESDTPMINREFSRRVEARIIYFPLRWYAISSPVIHRPAGFNLTPDRRTWQGCPLVAQRSEPQSQRL